MASDEKDTLPYNHVRRQDQAVNDEAWIKAFLHRAPFGVLATVADGQPFINTNLFVYDEHAQAIYMHTARKGRTPHNVAAGERVCFSASEMGRLLPADTALDFSVEYASVVVFGRASIIRKDEQARVALQRLLDKYFPHLRPGRDYRPIQAQELARTAVYRIDIENWSGKQERGAEDHPGAFFYHERPVME